MNKELKNLREQYEAIEMPDTLRERTKALMDEAKVVPVRRKSYWKSWASVAAMAGIVFFGSLNVSPSFAATVAQIPGMEGLVRILTLDRYEFNDGTMMADIVIPQIEGLGHPELEELINEELRKDGEQMIAKFEEDRQWVQEEHQKEVAHLSLDFDYEVKTDNEELLVLDTRMLEVVGSSMTIHKYYNVDKVEGKLLSLSDLMGEHPDYVAELSEMIREEMIRRNAAGEGTYWVEADDVLSESDVFHEIRPDQSFYIDENGQLVICFEKYEVAPGAMGTPEFVIPADYYQW